ncbi:MAG: hypothetical protein AAF414_06355, partial [Pseudomonadota bacterium]
MITSTLLTPEIRTGRTEDASIDAHMESRRTGRGSVEHTLTWEAQKNGVPLWSKEVTFKVEAPFEVPDLENDDPFLIASLFPAMEVGGVIHFHGKVSRVLLRNALDFQSAWALAATHLCRPFDLEVAEIDDRPAKDPGARPKSILAFTGGLDSMLALCRNVSGDAGPTEYDIGATLAIHGMGIGIKRPKDADAVFEELRGVSAGWDVPMAVVKTNLPVATDHTLLTHGTWLGACLSLFAGRFDLGLVGSSVCWFWPGWEVYGSHPLVDPLMSGAQMTIRDDEGLFDRVDKAALLAKYPAALRDLRVCADPYHADQNCCRCEKCIRTMLCFIASGNPIPPAFPHGIQLSDIGIGMGNVSGLSWAPVILDAAERYGTANEDAIRAFRRRYRVKRA